MPGELRGIMLAVSLSFFAAGTSDLDSTETAMVLCIFTKIDILYFA